MRRLIVAATTGVLLALLLTPPETVAAQSHSGHGSRGSARVGGHAVKLSRHFGRTVGHGISRISVRRRMSGIRSSREVARVRVRGGAFRQRGSRASQVGHRNSDHQIVQSVRYRGAQGHTRQPRLIGRGGFRSGRVTLIRGDRPRQVATRRVERSQGIALQTFHRPTRPGVISVARVRRAGSHSLRVADRTPTVGHSVLTQQPPAPHLGSVNALFPSPSPHRFASPVDLHGGLVGHFPRAGLHGFGFTDPFHPLGFFPFHAVPLFVHAPHFGFGFGFGFFGAAAAPLRSIAGPVVVGGRRVSVSPGPTRRSDRCIAVTVLTAEGTEHRVAVRPQTLGVSTAEEAALILDQQLQSGSPIVLKVLDGSVITLPSSVVEQIEVKPCP